MNITATTGKHIDSQLTGPKISSLVFIAVIRVYQRYLSPIKGYGCAYRILYGGPSCSSVGLDAFNTYDFSDAILIMKSRFADCHKASKKLSSMGSTEAIGFGCCGTGCSC